MADEFKYKIEDLYKEHSQHTSDDWENLQDKCSGCFKAIQELQVWLKERFPAYEELKRLTEEEGSNSILDRIELSRKLSGNPLE